MLDTSYMQRILKFIAEGSYEGVLTPDLWVEFVEAGANEKVDIHKLIYHMNEVANAGLIKERDVARSGWGFNPGADLDEVFLVLTPAGRLFLKLLSQPPEGLPAEKLDLALQANAGAGSAAFRFAVGDLLSPNSSRKW